jgi:hypothetical protein
MAPRIIAALGAIVTGGAALIGAVLLLFAAAGVAEPGVANRRSDVLIGSLVLATLEGALLMVTLVLAMYAAAGRVDGWRWLVGLPLGGALVLGLVVGLTL